MSYKTRVIPLRQLQGKRGEQVAINFSKNATDCCEKTGVQTRALTRALGGRVVEGEVWD